jgi:uncharacterized cysteine cluster protein YcgN (CxxCxxCC family)
MNDEQPFWRTKSLREMTDAEWESLCDGCGRCCLVKLEEEGPADAAGNVPPTDNPAIYYTDVGCRLLDSGACRCRDYPNRSAKVDDCVRLTPDAVAEIGWLPPTCAYRLLDEGRDLYWWHPLVSGDPASVHAAGVSVRGRVAFNEDEIEAGTIEEHIANWPLSLPKRARRGTK